MLRIYICMKSVVMWLCSVQAFWFWTYIIFMKRSVSFGKQECFTAVRNHLLVFFSVPLCVVSITNVLKQTGSPLAVRKYQCVEECGHVGHTEQATHGLSFFPYITLHGYMNHSDKAGFCRSWFLHRFVPYLWKCTKRTMEECNEWYRWCKLF